MFVIFIAAVTLIAIKTLFNYGRVNQLAYIKVLMIINNKRTSKQIHFLAKMRYFRTNIQQFLLRINKI